MNTRNCVEKLMYPYLDGTATSGKAPLRRTDYGSLRSMKFEGPLLYSYSTIIAAVGRANKILYLSSRKYSQTTTRQQKDVTLIAEKERFRVIHVSNITDYAQAVINQ
jgi:hypothetical protein|nr:MAG TPA: hypothetical protein [Caudoviricetes sp.]